MSSIKDLSYESVKELHHEFGIKVDVMEELKLLWSGIDENLIQACNTINYHFKDGGDSQSVSADLIKTNTEIRKLHSKEFIESPDQTPVTITTNDLSLQNLIELKNDVELIKKKTQGAIRPRTGTEAGWKKFIESTSEDLMLFIQTGFLDEKYLRNHGTGRLAGFMANQHGMTRECKQAAKMFKTVKEDIFDFDDVIDQEALTNQLQVDYIFIMVYAAKKQSMSIESLIEMSERCKLIFNKLPFTNKVLTQLAKSSKYPVLREIESNLKLHDSPFRLNRARFQAAISAITGCSSDRMISSTNAPSLLSKLMEMKHKDGVTVSSTEGSTSTYELILHSILTTPNVNSKIKNRTNVKRNGLNTVKFVEMEISLPILADKHSTRSKNIAEFTIKTPNNTKVFAQPSAHERELLGATKIITFLDIEGSPSEPNEVAIGTFFQRADNYWMREAVYYSTTPGKNYLQEAQHCHGLNLSAIEESGLQSLSIFKDAKSELDNFKKIHYFGKDIDVFLNMCAYKGERSEVNLPEWGERKKQGYTLAFQSKVCNKSTFHNITLKEKERDIQLKQLPHCASEDNIRMYNFVTSG
ncbi:nucleoprotein [big electron-dense squares virus 1]|uniref:Nucleoprotein n=1 Tax=big electron-dense squares virus 1 TaxID=3070918 RepID=A0AA46S008_9VIRU|nr:nucleoprotein [big electron-dense squares virus 1]UVT34683.1 nucleoprotein [big electron-dense squares virus 1]